VESLAEAADANKLIIQPEMIKESVPALFDHESVDIAEKHFDHLGNWIREVGFPQLKLHE
jgi:hemerythrin